MPVQTGKIINVPAGGNLQTAIDSAVLGDTIVLQAGATYLAPNVGFKLREKTTGTGWIVIQSSAMAALPKAGSRVHASDAVNMPKILSQDNLGAISTDARAHHYRLVGLEVSLTAGATANASNTGLVRFGNSEKTVLDMAHDMIVDRSYIHGNATQEVRRGVSLNCGSAAVIDSRIADMHEIGADSQAIISWSGSGPFKIENNYLEAASENIMFGGGDPGVTNMVASDVQVLRNHIYKPAAWKGGQWLIKNLLETKSVIRLHIDGNVIENNWGAAQAGFALLFKSTNQDGGCNLCQTADVIVTNNIIRHSGNFLNTVDSYSNPGATALPMSRLSVINNIIDDISGSRWSADGIVLQNMGVKDTTFSNNTVLNTNTASMVVLDNGSSGASDRFTLTKNIMSNGMYGIKGANMGSGTSTLNAYAPNWVVTGNAFMGGGNVPSNTYLTDYAAVKFVNFNNGDGGDYHLLTGSPALGAGADIDKVLSATAGVTL